MIEPANPQVVYVPQYDPWVVYGAPLVAYPDWVGVPGAYYAGPCLYWGLGFDVGLFAGVGWGWHHWGSIGVATRSRGTTTRGSRIARRSGTAACMPAGMAHRSPTQRP